METAVAPYAPPRRRTTLDINSDFMALYDLMDELGDAVLLDENRAELQRIFDELDCEMSVKLDNCAALIREFDGRATLRREEAKRLNALATTDENNAKRLKELVKYVLEKHYTGADGKAKLDTRRYKLWVQNNGGQVPIVMDPAVTSADVPEEYRHTEIVVTIDMEKVRADLEAGLALDFADFGEKGTHLRIK